MKFPALHPLSETGGIGPKIGFSLHITGGGKYQSFYSILNDQDYKRHGKIREDR